MAKALLRKCFELSGVVPLGVYLGVHVATYARVTFGATSFGLPDGSSYVESALEWLLVWLPLAFHAAYGIAISFSPVADPLAPSDDRLRRLLLRASGWFAAAFLVQHALWLRWPLTSGEIAAEDMNELLVSTLSSTIDGIPVVAAVHLAGLGVTCAHFGWGFGRFLERWGIAAPRRARVSAGLIALLLFAFGATAIVELATGSALPRFA
jgi:succinate dehydrogenase / fumarate reductase cytochrome b subunit